MKKTMLSSAALAAGLAVAGCGGAASVHSSALRTVATRTACQDLAHWENSGGAALLQNDPVSTKIIRESAGSRFGADFASWVKDLKGKSGDPAAAAAKVDSDCTRAGVPGALNGGVPTGQPGTLAKICKDIDYWWNFGNNSAIPGLIKESAGTQVGTDFATWMKIWNGTDTNAINAAAARVGTDCANAGVTSLRTDLGTGGSGGGTAGTPQPSSSAKPTPPPKPTPTPAPQTVTYVASGSSADVTYGPAGSNLQGTVPMSVTDPLASPAYYAVTAQLQGAGAVSCAIEVDGKTISSASATGGYNIASCEISQDPLSGQWVNTNG